MVFIIGGRSLCRTLNYIHYKTFKNVYLFEVAFRYQGLFLTINPSIVKSSSRFLTRGPLSTVNNFIIWHYLARRYKYFNFIRSSNNYQPSSNNQQIENLLLFRDRIIALVYSCRLSTGDNQWRLFGSQIIINDAVRKLNSHGKRKDSTTLSILQQMRQQL